MEFLVWILALIPVLCFGSLQGIGWLTGGMAAVVAMACPQAMATIGAMVFAAIVVAMVRQVAAVLTGV